MLCQAPTCFEIADRLTCVLTCKYALFLGQFWHVFGGPPFRLFLLVELSEFKRKQITKRDILPFPGWRPEQQAWLECWRWRQGLHSPLPLPAAEQGGRLPTITLQFVFLTNTSKILVFRFPSPKELPSSSPKLAPPLFLNSSATSLQPFALMRSDMSRHCHWCAQHNIIMHFIHTFKDLSSTPAFTSWYGKGPTPGYPCQWWPSGWRSHQCLWLCGPSWVQWLLIYLKW